MVFDVIFLGQKHKNPETPCFRLPSVQLDSSTLMAPDLYPPTLVLSPFPHAKEGKP